jgi:hypothetical protein
VSIPIRQDLCDDGARSINTQTKLLPGALAATTMLDSGPLPFADDGSPSAVDDEMKAALRCGKAETDIDLLATAGDRGVVGSFEVKSHQRQD